MPVLGLSEIMPNTRSAEHVKTNHETTMLYNYIIVEHRDVDVHTCKGVAPNRLRSAKGDVCFHMCLKVYPAFPSRKSVPTDVNSPAYTK